MMKQIAVVSVNKKKYSETFIRDQIMLLPAHVHYFYGGYLPVFYDRGYSFLPFPAGDWGPGVLHAHFYAAVMPGFLKKCITAYCRKKAIGAVLAHYGPTGVHMMDVCKQAGIPLFVYFHGYDIYRAAELKKYGSKYRKLFETAAGIFSVSHEMTQKLILQGAPPEKVIYNPCGANTEQFTYHDAGINPPLFVSVGRFDDTKDHSSTILAFGKVHEEHPEAQLRIIGTGKNLLTCRKLVAKLGLSQCVQLPGVLTHKDVAFEMSQARAFVLHSVTAADGDREGAPVSIMEAGASGLPVIATKHAGINDIVIDGNTGFLSEEKDINAMAHFMKLLIENPLMARQMGVNAHKRIHAHFSLRRNTEVVWDTINKIRP